MRMRAEDTRDWPGARRAPEPARELISRAWRAQDDEEMAWAELEDRVNAARLLQDETQPRQPWWRGCR
ncbi:hypothetical protein [Sediminicurvatus halobius]|nr:hypothetical protein [Spiribacter halobius]UEX76215.1 hypothetical protein LMH63_09570 [Spiribacter halobius]